MFANVTETLLIYLINSLLISLFENTVFIQAHTLGAPAKPSNLGKHFRVLSPRNGTLYYHSWTRGLHHLTVVRLWFSSFGEKLCNGS